MRQNSISLLLLVAVSLSLTAGCTQPSAKTPASPSTDATTPDAKRIAVISITSDPNKDLQKVNMGLTFAGFCVDEGYDVNIFLNVAGVKLATNSFSNELAFKNHSPLKQHLVALAKRGVQIHVCPVCMKDFEIAGDDIIPEAFVTDKPKLFAKLGADTMVFTY